MRAEELYSGNMAATVAKMHALYGHRLKTEDYNQLMSCSAVTDVAGYLKRTRAYSKPLEGIDTTLIHRGYLEDLLRRNYFENYFSLARFEKVADDEIYNYLTIKTEIDEILICITHINAGTDDHIKTLPIYMNRYTCFDLNHLAHVRSFEALLELLRKTPYYEMLAKYKPVDGGYINYRACELTLRTYYFRRLLAAAEDLHDDELADHICTLIDIINIVNAFRMKKHYHAPPETVKAAMIPIYNFLPEKKFNALYEADDPDEFTALLSKTIYGREAIKEGLSLESPESAMRYIRYKRLRRSFSMATTPPLCFFTYNHLKNIELDNIIRIIEGIRYQLPVTEIVKLLITD
ncbi:MAG: V-type ATPase subunit [Oscillospiraceae bacterium]|nr:V-type ATPase subunit [Oscillospiraceae bacterium]